MKFVLGAAAAVMLMAGVALAQTETPAPAAPAGPPAVSSCAAVPAEPTVPDGATATNEQVNAFNTAYQAWAATATSAIACRRAEVQSTQAAAQSLLEQHNALAQRINALAANWQTESAEYCGRRGNRCTQN